MKLFRRLTADVPGELLAAQIAASVRPAETTGVETASDCPSPDDARIFTILAVLAEHPGVLDANTPGLPTPAGYTTGEN